MTVLSHLAFYMTWLVLDLQFMIGIGGEKLLSGSSQVTEPSRTLAILKIESELELETTYRETRLGI